MKKFLMILMAIMLVMVNVAALAEDGDTIPELGENKVGGLLRTAGSPSSPVITKTYNSNVDGVYPTETLEFTVTKGNTSFPDITVGSNNTYLMNGVETADIPVNVPDADDYEEAGKYHYDVVETDPQTNPSQGVTYSTTSFSVDVYITYKIVDGKVTNELEKTVVIYSGAEVTTGNATTKDSEFENDYEVGGLTVTKAITGNLADPDKDFTIVITLNAGTGLYVNNDITVAVNDSSKASVDDTTGTSIAKGWTGSKTVTLTAKGDGSVTLSNIPSGVTYTVTETLDARLEEDTASAQLAAVNDPDAYYVSGEVTSNAPGTIGSSTASETITNKKEITVPTGIALDTVPYVLILAIALIGLARMGLRKREDY